MEDISTGSATVVKDSRGRIVLVIANDLSAVRIGESIPDGTLGWDKDSAVLSQYTSGAWAAVTADEFGVLRPGQVVATTSIYAPDNYADRLYVGSYYFESYTETFTFAGDGTLTGTTVIPDNAFIINAKVEVTTIIAGDSVAKFDVGLSVFNSADADALTPTQVATVTTGVKQRQQFKMDAIGPTASDFITISAFETDGTTPSDPSSGVVVVTALALVLP